MIDHPYGSPCCSLTSLTSCVFQVLMRVDERKAAWVGLALSALHQQLSQLPVPYTLQQAEADEHGLCRCCASLAQLTKSFADVVKRKDENYVTTPEDEELKLELLKL